MGLTDALLLDSYAFNVWIALRTDGVKGTGTASDPFDGSTEARFDAVMNSLPVNTKVHLGPGTFSTRGYADGVSGGWQPKPGMKIVGAGIDVTVLKLAAMQTSNAQFYAIGHDLVSGGQANLMDSVELSDLTIDCNVGGQGGTNVACGAVRLMGNHVRIQRVKARKWGANASRSCFVFSLVTGHVVGSTVTEVANCGFVECIAIEPFGTAGQVVTVFHTGAKDGHEGALVEAYARGPYIRECFVDCGSLPSNYEVRALSMGWCKGGIVQGNHVYNSTIAGPYQDNASSRDLVVRGNYYKNVLRGPYWKRGEWTAITALQSLTRNGSVALATTSADPDNSHNLQAGERLKMDASDSSPSQFKGIFVIKDVPASNQFRYQMASDPQQDASDAKMQKVLGINRVIVEDNLIELATSSTFAAIQVDDVNPGSQTPDYVHGDVIIRGNKIRFINGLLDPTYLGYGIEVNGAKTLTVRDNIVESALFNPLLNHRCGAVTYFNNRKPSGVLLRGLNADNNQKYTELQDEADDAFILAYLKHG
jgi:hypothetical protein